MLIEICESGILDNFVLKLKERKCTYAQLEINIQTNKVLKEYYMQLKESNHPRSTELAGYLKGARCVFKDYKCTSPCGFLEGIKETRII